MKTLLLIVLTSLATQAQGLNEISRIGCADDPTEFGPWTVEETFYGEGGENITERSASWGPEWSLYKPAEWFVREREAAKVLGAPGPLQATLPQMDLSARTVIAEAQLVLQTNITVLPQGKYLGAGWKEERVEIGVVKVLRFEGKAFPVGGQLVWSTNRFVR